MKIRGGFVSNSSSSSFIVLMDRELENYSISELKQRFFLDNGIDGTSSYGGDKIDLEKAVFTIIENGILIGKIEPNDESVIVWEDCTVFLDIDDRKFISEFMKKYKESFEEMAVDFPYMNESLFYIREALGKIRFFGLLQETFGGEKTNGGYLYYFSFYNHESMGYFLIESNPFKNFKHLYTME